MLLWDKLPLARLIMRSQCSDYVRKCEHQRAEKEQWCCSSCNLNIFPVLWIIPPVAQFSVKLQNWSAGAKPWEVNKDLGCDWDANPGAWNTRQEHYQLRHKWLVVAWLEFVDWYVLHHCTYSVKTRNGALHHNQHWSIHYDGKVVTCSRKYLFL